MKNIALFFVAVIALGTLTFAQTTTSTIANPAAGLKIGYVNSETVLQQLPEAIKANGQLESLAKQWKAELDSLGMILQQQYVDYQKQKANMPEAKRQEVEQGLLKQQQNLEDLQKKRFGQQNGDLYVKREELIRPIMTKILATIETVAKEENMQFVFEKPEGAIILYADNNFDLTFRVLDKLKRKN